MAVLPALDRARVAAHVMRGMLGSYTLLKAQLQSAVDATDQWIEDNQTSFNNSLPAVSRNALSTPQKTLLFCYVAMRRAGLLRVEGDT